jgi:hypothetical protein
MFYYCHYLNKYIYVGGIPDVKFFIIGHPEPCKFYSKLWFKLLQLIIEVVRLHDIEDSLMGDVKLFFRTQSMKEKLGTEDVQK